MAYNPRNPIKQTSQSQSTLLEVRVNCIKILVSIFLLLLLVRVCAVGTTTRILLILHLILYTQNSGRFWAWVTCYFIVSVISVEACFVFRLLLSPFDCYKIGVHWRIFWLVSPREIIILKYHNKWMMFSVSVLICGRMRKEWSNLKMKDRLLNQKTIRSRWVIRFCWWSIRYFLWKGFYFATNVKNAYQPFHVQCQVLVTSEINISLI